MARTSSEQISSPKHEELRVELTRQRAALLELTNLSLTVDPERQGSSDPVDQASADQEQTAAFQVKMRIFAKLKRIERALLLIRTPQYGRCRRCRRDIPYERLKAQPDALYCVPCLRVIEQDLAVQ